MSSATAVGSGLPPWQSWQERPDLGVDVLGGTPRRSGELLGCRRGRRRDDSRSTGGRAQVPGRCGHRRERMARPSVSEHEVPLGPDVLEGRREGVGLLAQFPGEERRDRRQHAQRQDPAEEIAQGEVGEELHRPPAGVASSSASGGTLIPWN